MLSYRHGFHAGGWADVHKHVTLTLALAALRKKPTPFTVVDAYAGDAIYDLESPDVQKTREFETGIVRIANADPVPDGVRLYLEAVWSLNPGGQIKRYPGSPALALAFLREADRLVANELHPTGHRALAAWAGDDHRISVHRRDALEFLGWIATPRLRRGLVVIDPAYEVKSDYVDLPATLARVLKAWPHGIYAIWYPVLVEGRHRAMLGALARTIGALTGIEALIAEITPPPAVAQAGMRGAGLAIINPPWGLASELAAAGAWLADALWAPGRGRHVLHALTPRASLRAGR